MTNYQKYPRGGTGYVVWALRRIGGAAYERLCKWADGRQLRRCDNRERTTAKCKQWHGGCQSRRKAEVCNRKHRARVPDNSVWIRDDSKFYATDKRRFGNVLFPLRKFICSKGYLYGLGYLNWMERSTAEQCDRLLRGLYVKPLLGGAD